MQQRKKVFYLDEVAPGSITQRSCRISAATFLLAEPEWIQSQTLSMYH
jgi:hypothetical protein